MEDKIMDSNVIYSYTWDDAIEDGTFIRVPEAIQKEAGIKYPTAITSNLYNTYIKPNDKVDEQGRLWDLLWMFKNSPDRKDDGNMRTFTLRFGKARVTVWVVCEARSPDNPEPIITFMLPEDR
jgi:hypothetical protein